MPATPEEMQRLVDAFEKAHPPLARVLADLFLRGRCILEDHHSVGSSVVPEFEKLVVMLAQQQGMSEIELSAAIADLRRVQVTVEQLERLP